MFNYAIDWKGHNAQMKSRNKNKVALHLFIETLEQKAGETKS